MTINAAIQELELLGAIAKDIAQLEDARHRRPLTMWRAWDRPAPRTSQLRALQMVGVKRTVFVFGGNRSGKTELLRAVLVALLIGSDHPDAAAFWRAHGLDPDLFPRGPGHGWIIAPRASDSLAFHRRQILALIPKWGPRHPYSIGEGKNWHAWSLRAKDEATLEIMVPGYEEPARILFKSDEPGPDGMQGDSCRAILHDEESLKHGRLTWEEADVRLWDQDGWHLMSNTPNRGRTWLWHEHVNVRPEDEGVIWIWSEDNPHLSQVKINKLKAGDASIAAIRNKGEFVALEGRVWPVFSRATHVVPRFEIPEGSARFRAIDFGTRNPFCCLWACLLSRAVDLPDGRRLPDGARVVYREHYRAEWTLAQHAAAIRAKEGATFVGSIPHDEAVSRAIMGEPVHKDGDWVDGESFEVTWCDPEDPQQMMQLAHTHGFEVTRARKAVPAGLNAVREAMDFGADGMPGWYVVEDCVNTIAENEMYVRGPGETEKPQGQVDHACDCQRYLEMGIRASMP